MRKLAFLCLLASALLLNACSSGSSDAPADRNAHPEGWLVEHSAEVAASPDYNDCTGCHGIELDGSGDAVSCFSCHAFNTSPPFTIHPDAWSDAYASHRAYAALNGFDECLGCHGAGLRGSPAAPSCFSDSVDGRGCHAEGPAEVPHALDGSYLAGNQHGPEAKQDLTACQPCHGEAGGPGDNPRFNAGIFSAGGDGCESCHALNSAHPQNWAGPNSTFHYSAGSIQQACTLCHGESLDGVDAAENAVSCLGCHASATTFTLDCTFCHGYPPDGSADLDVPIPVPHGDVADISLHVECLICHGMYEATTGTFSPASNYALFDKATDTNGDHWDGNIQMSASARYNAENFGCDAASCHGATPNTPEFQLSDSGLPVILKFFFGGD